ncbi:MAG TPA: hypothetical protein VGR96_09635 [Acidobacteriaceae bacterium]|nr:hypothetical protein [Acidobacteriaceae bacterium]
MTASVRRAGSLGPRRRRALYVIGVGVWLTGGLWLIFHYFLVRQGEFGPVANPLEAWWLKLHGAFAFAALWIFGLLWGIHITKLWKHKNRRWSGGILAGIFVLLILSGYLLYYVGDDTVRPLISMVHWGIGLTIPFWFVWHRIQRRVRQRSADQMKSMKQHV